jgi:hypothetical protein
MEAAVRDTRALASVVARHLLSILTIWIVSILMVSLAIVGKTDPRSGHLQKQVSLFFRNGAAS